LELLQSFKCPTVIRITAVRGLNMGNVEEYAKLIEKANPTYIEPKAFMHVGFSRLRLGYEGMPNHREIREFAFKLAQATGYKVVDESEDSRVVLLSQLDKPLRLSHG
jgi:tRNA wybutosine-synthesizing protein 1